MKTRAFFMAALIALLPILLVSCEPSNDPGKIEEDSADMLALAESVLGMKPAAAATILKAADLKEDADSANTYVKGNRLTAYIALTIKDGVVSAVELGKDHTTRTDAMVTEKVWSKYTTKEALPDYSLWIGSLAVSGDTTNYMAGTLVQTIRDIFSNPLLSEYIPQSIKDQVYAAMENDNKSFQLALYESDPEKIDAISEMAYKAEFSLSEIPSLVTGKEVESASCEMEEKIVGKKTYYRVTYTHDLRQLLKLSEIYQ